jgi:Lon protease-like protein
MKSARLACAISILILLCVPGAVQAQQSGVPNAPRAADTLPATIPIFPLQDVMLFPNNSRPLYIFEPRYRAMVADALKGDRIIGMVLLRPGFEADYEGRPPVYPIGCAGEIADVEQMPDGRYAIVLRGTLKFRILDEDQSRPYRIARVETIAETLNDAERKALREQRPRLNALVATALRGAAPPPTLSDEELVNGLAQYLDLEPSERQELLERKGAVARAEALINLLERR